MSAIDDLIASAVARTVEVRVLARGDLTDRHEAMALEWNQWLAVEGDDALAAGSTTRDLHAKLAALEAEIDDAAVTIRMQTIPAYKWANLLRLHPPSKEQRAQGFDNNPDTFPVAIVAACALEPAITEEQATELRNTLPPAEWGKLWSAAFLINTEETPSPKLAAATASLLANGPSSTPASTEGSLAQPSSGGSGAQ